MTDERNPEHPDHRSFAAVWRAIHELEEQQVSSQESVDALTAAVGTLATELEADTTTIQTELDKLEGEVKAGQPVKLEALQAAVAALDPKAKALGELAPKA